MMLFTLGGFFKSIISLFKTRVLSDGGTFEAETNLENQLNTLGSDLFNSASLVITPNGVKTSKLYSIKPSDGTGDLSVTRATKATRVDESGVIVDVLANVARIDYSNGSAAILSEPQRTNLFLRSEEFNISWKQSSSSVTPDTTLAPTGLVKADTITSTGISQVTVLQLRTITSGTVYSISFYIKQNTQRFVYIRFTSNSLVKNTYVSAVFDLQDGTTGQTSVGTTSGTLISSDVRDAGNGFYRVSITASINATDGNIGIGFAPAKTGNTFNTVGTITSTVIKGNSIFLWGAQLEEGSTATSYIPTTTSSVTRNADVISKTGLSGITSITETFENGTTNVISGSPTSYTMSQGRIKQVIGL